MTGYGQIKELSEKEISIPSKTDSIQQIPDAILQNAAREIDSMLYQVSFIRDSIAAPLVQFQHKTDSLNSLIEYIENIPRDIENKILSPVQKTVDKISDKLTIKNQSFKIGEMQVRTDGIGIKNILPKTILPDLGRRLDLPEIPVIKTVRRFETVGRLETTELINKYLPKELHENSGELQKLYNDVNSRENIDKFIDQQAMKMDELAEVHKMSGQTGMMNTGMDALSSLDQLKIRESLKNNKIREQTLKKLADKGQEYLSDHLEQIPEVKEKMMELKKKYSYVGSINDLEHAEKRNSLKDEPLRKRLVLGGNIQVKRAEPLSIDLSPSLGYKFNKKFTAGVTGTWRFAILYHTKYNFQIPSEMYGYGSYASYRIFNGFFGHFEMESKCYSKKLDDITTQKIRANGLFIGIGNEYRIYKSLRGTVILMYNTLHNDQSPDPKPWQIKFGFKIN